MRPPSARSSKTRRRGWAKLQKLTGPLTDAQKELITAMAESGDVAGAQAAVLDILEGKFGGTAEATATDSQKMGVAFGEVSEAVGGVLLPDPLVSGARSSKRSPGSSKRTLPGYSPSPAPWSSWSAPSNFGTCGR